MWKIGCRNKSRHLCVGLASGEDQISLCVPRLRKRPLALRVGPLCWTFTWTLIQFTFQSAPRGLQNLFQVHLHHITPNAALLFNFQLQPCLKHLSKLEGFIGIPDSKVWFFNNFYFSIPSTSSWQQMFCILVSFLGIIYISLLTCQHLSLGVSLTSPNKMLLPPKMYFRRYFSNLLPAFIHLSPCLFYHQLTR